MCQCRTELLLQPHMSNLMPIHVEQWCLWRTMLEGIIGGWRCSWPTRVEAGNHPEDEYCCNDHHDEKFYYDIHLQTRSPLTSQQATQAYSHGRQNYVIYSCIRTMSSPGERKPNLVREQVFVYEGKTPVSSVEGEKQQIKYC